MLGFLKTKPVLDDESTLWLFDAFTWSLQNFNAEVFYQQTRLVQPSNQFFPGRESSADGMANLILEQVKNYAGLSHWPSRAADANSSATAPGPVMIENPQRSLSNVAGKVAANTVDGQNELVIPYHPSQLAKPESLIANYATILSYYLAQTADQPPPGGEPFLPQATELVAVFLGFGIMLANSAYTFRGGCGSCYNPLAERSASLSQDEASYALAIFCALKNIPSNEVLPHLKSYLRPVFKRAVNEIRKSRQLELLRLRPESDAATLSHQPMR